jgi:hypothetical protein
MLALPLPAAPPTLVSGSGNWGNDWSGSIFDRSTTIKASRPGP